MKLQQAINFYSFSALGKSTSSALACVATGAITDVCADGSEVGDVDVANSSM